MTRETKIGLLVGLGFIVVFAVLLSHNGSGPSPTAALAPMAANSADSSSQAGNASVNPPVGEIGNPQPTAVVENTGNNQPAITDPITDTLVASGTGDDLPSPGSLERSGIISSGSPSDTQSGVHDDMTLADASKTAQEPSRIMPQIVEPPAPAPIERPVEPAVTPAPTESASDALASNFEPGAYMGQSDNATHSVAAAGPAKSHLVQKGENLLKIAKECYGKSTPAVISFVVDANKGTIKGRDSLREGQTILLPPLPPDMFEQQTVSASGSTDLKTVQHLIEDAAQGSRRAPETAVNASPEKNPTSADSRKDSKLGQPSLPIGPSGQFIPIGASTKQQEKTTADKTASDKVSVEKAADKPVTDKSKAKSSGDKAKAEKADAGKKDSKAEKADQPGKPKSRSGSRTYEIQPKDTFSSIAERELGSKTRWAEIKQMNKEIDPSKMKPGMKIRIPSKDPLSGDISLKRASA